MANRKFLTLPGLEHWLLDCPPRSQLLYRLSYPGSSLVAVQSIFACREWGEAVNALLTLYMSVKLVIYICIYSERRLFGHSFYRRNFLRKSCATCREKCRRMAPRTEKTDKPAQWTPYTCIYIYIYTHTLCWIHIKTGVTKVKVTVSQDVDKSQHV
jgi:hypothetical protein